MNTEHAHAEFEAWLYRTQTQYEPDDLNKREIEIARIAFIEGRAALQSQDEKARSKIHDKSYAGVYVWFGDVNLVEHIPKIMAESARLPESMLEVVVENAIRKLGRFVDLQAQDREDAAYKRGYADAQRDSDDHNKWCPE